MTILEMTTTRLKSDLADVRQAAELTIVDGASVPPTWMIYGADGLIRVINTPWDGDEEKQVAVRLVRTIMAAYDANAWTFICEAWGVSESPDPEVRKLRVSQRSDRRELILIQGGLRAPDGEVTRVGKVINIHRHEDAPATFSEDVVEGEFLPSWMFDRLFDWGEISDTMRQITRMVWDDMRAPIMVPKGMAIPEGMEVDEPRDPRDDEDGLDRMPELGEDWFKRAKLRMPEPEPVSWAPHVRTGPEWTKNGLRFGTKAEAEAWAYDLSGRWTAVEEYGAVESTDPVNYRFDLQTRVLERLSEQEL